MPTRSRSEAESDYIVSVLVGAFVALSSENKRDSSDFSDPDVTSNTS